MGEKMALYIHTNEKVHNSFLGRNKNQNWKIGKHLTDKNYSEATNNIEACTADVHALKRNCA